MNKQNEKSDVITIEQLDEKLRSLKHDIDIETIQQKLKLYESFFKRLEGDTEILFELIDWYKNNKPIKSD